MPSAETFFDSRVGIYDREYEAVGSGGHTLRTRLAVTLALAGEGPGDALDVGFGPGRLLCELAGRGWTASGVDVSGAMVAQARARLPDAAARILQGDAEKLPFTAESFDLVTATGIMEYVQDRPRALAEFARVLRPGGRVVVSVPNPVALYARCHRPYMRSVDTVYRIILGGRRPHGQSGGWIDADRFTELIRGAGLEPERRTHAGYLAIPLPIDAAVPRLAARLAGSLEGRGTRLGRMLATQVVFAASR